MCPTIYLYKKYFVKPILKEVVILDNQNARLEFLTSSTYDNNYFMHYAALIITNVEIKDLYYDDQISLECDLSSKRIVNLCMVYSSQNIECEKLIELPIVQYIEKLDFRIIAQTPNSAFLTARNFNGVIAKQPNRPEY